LNSLLAMPLGSYQVNSSRSKVSSKYSSKVSAK
jgi:hypothetical protein